MRLLRTVLLSFALLAATSAIARAGDETTLKLATLAPEGSTWWKVFQKADQRVKELTSNRVRIRIYAGGVAGDEPDVVKKMRVGSLHAAALTSIGLAEIQPALMALQAPGAYEGWGELDAARTKLADRFSKLLAEKGYVVLTWGDVGFDRIFSVSPVKTPADLKNGKYWLWTHDGIHKALFEAASLKPVPLAVPDVMPSLQTGVIDAIITSPLAAVSLQWFSRTKYMLDVPVNVTIGAIVVTQKSLEKLSAQDRAALLQVGQEITPELAAAVRQDNDKAVEAVKKAGVQVITVDAATKQQWQALFDSAADKAAGPVFPKELLTEIRQAVAASRKK